MVDCPHGGNSQARAVKANGSIIVGSANSAEGRSRAARWTGSADPEILGELSVTANVEFATGVSGDGTVVVGTSSHFDQGARAVRWKGTGEVEDLNTVFADVIPSGWILRAAYGVSADGTRIVGEARAADGTQTRGFVVTTGGR
jgi:uncharacterized membrane protein